ncbi:MAG: recombination mediator RecR [Gammaproteobacteria bacterium]|nr:recombination mediator RecR [Gammaproteobacteria bacterium]
MAESQLISHLIDALRCLPGIGPKSAQRIAYHLLQRDNDGARRLADALNQAVDKVGHCERCRAFSDRALCPLCSSPKRDRSLLCVVESPTDVRAVEEADYRGLYFVLMGHLSPLDGIGPEDLGIDQLGALLDEGDIKEVILATNLTVEGEATAYYVGELVHAKGIRATRIAHGVPLGGELEYIDSGTLSQAIVGRREI